MSKSALFSILILLLVLFGLFILFFASYPYSTERQMRIHGEFVLVNQQRIYQKVINFSRDIRDLRELFAKLEDSLDKEPYIRSAAIRHVWPDIIMIDIDEVGIIARINF